MTEAPHTCEYLILQCSGNFDCCPKRKDRLVTDDGCICFAKSGAVLEELERRMKHLHDVEELSYPDLWNEFLIQIAELRQAKERSA